MIVRSVMASTGSVGAIVAFTVAAACLSTTPVLGRTSDDPMVACAWSKVPATAATLVDRVKFDAQYAYDADGSPTVGPLMRVWAACADEKATLVAARKYEDRVFLKRLRGARPATVAADMSSQRVFRCESRFGDDPAAAEPVAIGWGFGDDLAAHQLRYTTQLQGSMTSIPSTMLNDDRAMLALLKTAQQDSENAAAVETRKDGVALGRPYTIKDGGGRRTCRFVQPDGSYVDA